MIYAIRATEQGRQFAHTDNILENFTLQRATILYVSLKKMWTTWIEIDHALIELRDSGQCDADTQQRLTRYINDHRRIVDDVLTLEKLSYIDAARYRTPAGQYIKEKPAGMTFRM